MSELWRNLIAGDSAAFSEIYESFFKVLYAYGYQFAADPAVVKDAIQELFTDLWRLKENLSETTSVKYYLFRSLRRRLRLVAEQTFQALPVSEKDLADLYPVDSQEEALMVQETQDLTLKRLTHAVNQLTSRQREALRLRYYEGFSFSEAASIMNMNEQSVRNLTGRALVSLRTLV